MKITYRTKSLEKICTEPNEARKRYGEKGAEILYKRLAVMRSFNTVDTLISSHIGKCHLLTGNRKGQYALHIKEPYRIVFEIIGNEIQIAYIIEIVDYH